MENVNKDAKEVFVKSPFSVELDMKQNEFCYISAQQHIEEDEEYIEELEFTTNIFVNGVEKAKTVNKPASIAWYLLME